MATELRKTGISVLGDMPWGTHLCHFHETTADLLATVVPYCKAGLADHEFCLWVRSKLLTEADARGALRQAVPELDRYLAERHIEILPHTEWYLKGGAFDLHRVINGWHEKLAQALARGYAGMRVIGCTAWLEKKHWRDFREYETELNESIAHHRLIVLCAYSLAASGAADILDVARAHQFTVARRQGEWEVIETPELKQAKAKIKRLNEELEHRVVERTRELTATNEALRREITERKLAEDGLRKQKEILQKIFDYIPAMISFIDEDGRFKLVNREWERTIGWTLEEIQRQNLDVWAECYPDPQERQYALNFLAAATGEWADVKIRVRDGRVIDTTWACVHLTDGMRITIGQDITTRKRAEEALRATSEQLRALSARLRSAREEEGTRIARELHDELGSALTSVKWDLEGIDKLCSEASNQIDPSTLQEKIAGMMGLIDATINTVKKISAELRPSILDDLGLVAAIEWQAQQFAARTGIHCQVDSFVDATGLSREQATAVFRILQEALTNILRHAQATQVNIMIEEDEGEFVLEVKDNGRGIAEDESRGSRSLGLMGMRERAHLVGGRIKITGVAGKGTVLTVRVPLASQAVD